MNRRDFIALLPAVAAAPRILAVPTLSRCRIGICSFSCHQHWKAVAAKYDGVKFTDAPSFYRYARLLGGEGVQTSLRSTDLAVAKGIRTLVEEDNGYFEGELRLPKSTSELADFEADVRLNRVAGAEVARAVFTGNRRYETFKTLAEFRDFHGQAEKTLALIEPILSKHRLHVAIENHKDHTVDELSALMRKFSSEWIGVLVDTGNNIALLDEPYAAIETLAPFALSTHFKDMAVQVCDEGFLLSEVPPGDGALDLPRIVSTLRRANSRIVFNLEMATRDPLLVPCLADAFFATFPDRKAERLNPMMDWVKAHPPAKTVPRITGKTTSQILKEEEDNNRDGLMWMRKHIH